VVTTDMASKVPLVVYG